MIWKSNARAVLTQRLSLTFFASTLFVLLSQNNIIRKSIVLYIKRKDLQLINLSRFANLTLTLYKGFLPISLSYPENIWKSNADKTQ